MSVRLFRHLHGIRVNRPAVAWIDGVGGLALVTADEVTIGRDADLSISANLPRVAMTIRRRGEDWFVGDDLILDDKPTIVGGEVQFVMRRPGFLTSTRRLELQRPHRWTHSVDSVLLISKIATIGPTATDSVCAPHLERTHFLSHVDETMSLRCEQQSTELIADQSVTAGELRMMVRPWKTEC